MLIYVNGNGTHVAAKTTVATLIEHLGYVKETFAVAVNKQFIARSDYAKLILQPQDQIDIVSAMQGG